jgi:hypothetical protein
MLKTFSQTDRAKALKPVLIQLAPSPDFKPAILKK